MAGPALGSSGPKQQDLAFADWRLDRRDAAIEILLAPRPSAPERSLAVEPRDRLNTAAVAFGPSLNTGLLSKNMSVCSASRARADALVDARREHRARHVELRAGNGVPFSTR